MPESCGRILLGSFQDPVVGSYQDLFRILQGSWQDFVLGIGPFPPRNSDEDHDQRIILQIDVSQEWVRGLGQNSKGTKLIHESSLS